MILSVDVSKKQRKEIPLFFLDSLVAPFFLLELAYEKTNENFGAKFLDTYMRHLFYRIVPRSISENFWASKADGHWRIFILDDFLWKNNLRTRSR